jgi:glycosyltransferase involved in cell wall biosynthesis
MLNMTVNSISVILPVKNEGKRLAITLSDIHSYLKNKEIEHEIIAVISAGSDHSEELAKRLTLGIKELKILILKDDKGKGHAIKRGLKEAKHPWILIMNSDNSVSIVEIEKMLPYAEDKNLILGTRNSRELKTKPGLLKTFLASLTKQDSHSGFHLLNQKLAKKILKESKASNRLVQEKFNKPSFQTEIIEIAKQAKVNVIELPITWQL